MADSRSISMAIRRAFLEFLGASLVVLPPCRLIVDKMLATWHNTAARGPLTRLLFDFVFDAWVRRRYLREPDPDRREQMKMICMAGASGRAWAEDYNRSQCLSPQMMGTLLGAEADPSFDALSAACAAAAPATQIIQIGCSSGRQIAHFAARHPHLSFAGFDIAPEIIDYVRDTHKLPNLEFFVGFAQSMPDVLARVGSRPLILFSHGSLQYVQPEHVDIFFRHTAKHPNLRVILSEPASDELGPPEELEGSLWRWNFSYTHNYRYYAERWGFVTERCGVAAPYRDRPRDDPRYHTMLYFYQGKTSITPCSD